VGREGVTRMGEVDGSIGRRGGRWVGVGRSFPKRKLEVRGGQSD